VGVGLLYNPLVLKKLNGSRPGLSVEPYNCSESPKQWTVLTVIPIEGNPVHQLGMARDLTLNRRKPNLHTLQKRKLDSARNPQGIFRFLSETFELKPPSLQREPHDAVASQGTWGFGIADETPETVESLWRPRPLLTGECRLGEAT